MTEITNGEYWLNQVAQWGVGESKERAREVRATIAALRARVTELEAATETLNERQRLEWSRAETAEAEAGRLMEALLKYGDHLDSNCAPMYGCSCGLTDALGLDRYGNALAASPVTEPQADDSWLAMLREVAKLSDAIEIVSTGESDEWALADDGDLLEQFDPWDVIEKATEWIGRNTGVTEPQAAQAGERERVAEALIEWASREYIYFRPDSNTPNTCLFCEVSLEDEEEIHAPDCLHLRAKALRALRADAGGSGEGRG